MNNFTEGFYKFFIPGRLPGLNDYTAANRYNRYAGAKMKKDTEEKALPGETKDKILELSEGMGL